MRSARTTASVSGACAHRRAARRHASRRATSSATSCTSRCRTDSCRRCGAGRSTGASAKAARASMAIASARSPPSSRCTSSRRATCRARSKYLLQAAENATHRSAQHEAAALARRGLQALESLPETPERAQQELSLRLILGVALMATKGFAAAEVESVFRRALILCEQYGAAPQAFMVQWLLGLFHYFRAEMQPARQIAAHLLELAGTPPDPAIAIEAHRAMGVTLVDCGLFIGIARPPRHGLGPVPDARLTHTGLRRPGPEGRQRMLCGASAVGARLSGSSRRADSTRAGAGRADCTHRRASSSPTTSRRISISCAARPRPRRRTPKLVIALADEYGLELWTAFGHMNRGWARSEQGVLGEGIHELRRGLTAYEATGARLWRAHFLGLLAQVLGRADRPDEGLAVIAEAIGLALTADSGSAADLHRIQGDLLTGRSPDQAEACFEQARHIALEQQARSWELRAVTSLARLNRSPRKRADARRRLRATHDWFVEGHETADLRRAREVLGDHPE